MAILHVLLPAILAFVGQSTPCVEWMILNPPIIFGNTAELLCSPVTSNISSNTSHVTSWLGGKMYSILATNGGTADYRKYAEIQRWHRRKFESILRIYKFDEKDVNVNYSCSIGGCDYGSPLSLTLDKFEYHPDNDTTTVLTSFRNGYLDVTIDIIKVYPIPKCTIMFNENIISQQLTTKTSVNGIFCMVVVEVDQRYIDVCSGQLIVTCVVGKTEIPIHQETFNKCRKTKEELPVNSDTLYISISILVLLCSVPVIGMVCLYKYKQFKNFLCCNLRWGRKETTSQTYGEETADKLLHQEERGSSQDAGHSLDMTYHSPRNSDNDSSIITTE